MKKKNIEYLNNKKQELFDQLIKIDPKDNRFSYKKKIKKFEDKIDEIENENKFLDSSSFELIEKNKKKINNLNKQVSEFKEKLKEVVLVEEKIYKLKKATSSKVYSLDKLKNLLNSNILLIKNKISNYEEKIKLNLDNSELVSLKKDYQEELKSIKFKINYYKEKGKTNPIFLIKKANVINSDIKKLDKKINNLQKININNIRLKINLLEEKLSKEEKEYKTLMGEINNYVKIIDECDEILSSNKEINSNYSFIIKNLNIFYGKNQAINNLSFNIPKNKIISIIGPSGCGKSTFLRTLNRINDEIPSFNVNGKILLDGEYDIYKLRSIKNKYDKIELTELRTKVGMIFQQPNPFPMSIYKNVSFGPRINGIKNKEILNEIVENSLKDAAIWDEVKNDLNALGTSLSGGQQQRLCIARAIANEPEILLMDEPTSALDPIASSKIENLMLKLKKKYTLIIVTHSMQQAARISDYTAFFFEGKLIEFDKTKKIFSNPREKKTDDYIRGKFG